VRRDLARVEHAHLHDLAAPARGDARADGLAARLLDRGRDQARERDLDALRERGAVLVVGVVLEELAVARRDRERTGLRADRDVDRVLHVALVLLELGLHDDSLADLLRRALDRLAERDLGLRDQLLPVGVLRQQGGGGQCGGDEQQQAVVGAHEFLVDRDIIADLHYSRVNRRPP
jgi:hypothetical protein